MQEWGRNASILWFHYSLAPNQKEIAHLSEAVLHFGEENRCVLEKGGERSEEGE